MTYARRFALILGILSTTATAWAQSAPTIISQWTSGTAGQFNVQWSNPNTSSPQQIACSPASGNSCFLLNLAACSAAPVPLAFTATPMGSTVPASSTSQNIFIWGLLNQTCATGYASGATNNPNPNTLNGSYLVGLESNVSSTFLNQGGQGMSFPGNVPYVGGLDQNGNNTGTTNQLLYTHLDLMNMYFSCQTGVNLSTFYLCIGVDGNGTGCVGQACGASSGTVTTPGVPTSGGGDYIAWAQVQIDTLPPNPPTIVNPKPLNGRVRFTVNYDMASLDTYTINVYVSSDPNNVASVQAGGTCDTWAPGSYQIISNGVQPQTGTLPMTINGNNGTTYAYCAQAVDYLRNPSTFSAAVTLTPEFECDLFDCYPGELQTGFCGAALTPAWFLLPLAAVGARRVRRRHRA